MKMNMLAVIAIITLLVMMVIAMTIRHCGVWVGIALVGNDDRRDAQTLHSGVTVIL